MLTNRNRIIIQAAVFLAVVALIFLIISKKSAAENNREEIEVLINDISSHALTHFKRTDSFDGWEIPNSLKNEKIAKIRTKIDYNKVIIYAVGTELGDNGISNVNMMAVITPSGTNITRRN